MTLEEEKRRAVEKEVGTVLAVLKGEFYQWKWGVLPRKLTFPQKLMVGRCNFLIEMVTSQGTFVHFREDDRFFVGSLFFLNTF